jgi:hypothetical protein
MELKLSATMILIIMIIIMMLMTGLPHSFAQSGEYGGQLLIHYDLIQSEDSIPESTFFDAVGYRFFFNGVNNSVNNQNPNYLLEGVFDEVLVSSSSVSLFGTLKITETKGNMRQTVPHGISGLIDIESIRENTATGQTEYMLNGGLVNIGDDWRWREPKGLLTLSPSNTGTGMLQGVLIIEVK